MGKLRAIRVILPYNSSQFLKYLSFQSGFICRSCLVEIPLMRLKPPQYNSLFILNMSKFSLVPSFDQIKIQVREKYLLTIFSLNRPCWANSVIESPCPWRCGSVPSSPRGAKEVPGEQSSLPLFLRPLIGPQFT